MRITIPTTGSRGDVQPYVALGAALRDHGHEVVVSTHADFEGFVREHDLEFHLLEPEGGKEMHDSDYGDRLEQAGNNPFIFLREFTRMRLPKLQGTVQRCWEACKGADAIIATNTEFIIAEAVGEREEIPVIWSSLQPVAPTRYYPNCLFPPLPDFVPGKGIYNFTTHAVTGWSMWLPVRKEINRARVEVLGLKPLPLYGPASSFLTPRLSLHGYSEHIAPPPPDLAAHHHVTGFWFLDPAVPWEPPVELQRFLDQSPRPFCIGFGSMHDKDARKVTEMFDRVLERTGQRAVVLTGWGGLEESAKSSRIFPLEAAPHSKLFPRTAGVIHHGGAGTTAAGLHAGVPSLLCPFMADQPYWGRRIHELGVGPEPLPHDEIDEDSLADRIHAMVHDGQMQRAAARLGELVRAEQGTAKAAELVNRHLEQGMDSPQPISFWKAIRHYYWDRPRRDPAEPLSA